MIIVFLFLTYFTLYDRLWVHPLLYKWPTFVPFYGSAIFHCVYVWHLFNSSVNGHLIRFHVLASVHSAAMNIGVHVSFWTMVFSGYMPSRLLLLWQTRPAFGFPIQSWLCVGVMHFSSWLPGPNLLCMPREKLAQPYTPKISRYLLLTPCKFRVAPD